jgi:hypothetical protein
MSMGPFRDSSVLSWQCVDKSLRFVMAQPVRHLETSLLESSYDKSMSAWYASYIEAT